MDCRLLDIHLKSIQPIVIVHLLQKFSCIKTETGKICKPRRNVNCILLLGSHTLFWTSHRTKSMWLAGFLQGIKKVALKQELA